MIYSTLVSNIIEKMYFSDGSSVKSRSSKLIEKGNKIGFSIDIKNLNQDEAERIKNSIIDEISNINNKLNLSIIFTTDNSNNKNILIDKVGKVILVASGKGGVGKSTITSLLAYGLRAKNFKVGIVDLDIYGPSIAIIFNIKGKAEIKDNRMVPLIGHNDIKLNSIAFLTKEDEAVSFRGPMASKAIYQLISLTDWGELDYLIIDTPPGTGDIHLSLLQNYSINKIVMVTTPQLLAGSDVARSINLYNKFNKKVDFIIENMCYYQNINGDKIELFKGNAAGLISAKYDIPILTKLPILPELSELCDKGANLEKFSNLISIEGLL